ncbi:MAG TPA: endolytic transglycosylase MltG [Burkholderiales bacterium]|nr:endolytic transglycosylase MltG [Burkholderiales bacterium]
MGRSIKRTIVILILAAIGGAGWLTYFASTPRDVPQPAREFLVKKGRSLRGVSGDLTAAGVFKEPWSFFWLGRILGHANDMQAGVYRIPERVTPLRLLEMIVNGEVTEAQITFIEGWTFAQVRAALAQHPHVTQETAGLSDRQILERIRATEHHPEGLFFPDTYFFRPGVSDLTLLARAYETMKAKLDALWLTRAPNLPYRSPYEALIMASIVEKETGFASERPMIAAVFVNRLRKQMRLQTDPSVIYGLGANFDGNLRKRDLETDTPYNTYTRTGLPPTPIAMPGEAALQAALRPADSPALYFVSKGDGTSKFSHTLEDHNRAVRQYQLGR